MVNQSSVLCPECGNYRRALEVSCPYCNSEEKPLTAKKSTGIYTLNLETGLPTVARALEKFEDSIIKLSATSIAMVRVIHGYGSSGIGGRIKEAVHQHLIYGKQASMIDRFCAGEDLVSSKSAYKEMPRKWRFNQCTG
mgnify:CR=1 FL=1